MTVAGALVCALLVVAAGCSHPRPSNVVIVVVDTLRFNHLGCYGYARNTTPGVDRFAGEAIRFDRAYASSSWTEPSVASMLTGLYPSAHTVYRMERSLPDAAETLAEILKDAGYTTAAVISHRLIGASTNFDQGFEVFDELNAKGYRYRSTPGVTAKAISLLHGFAGQERPFFLLVHYFDPHYNYNRHPAFGFAPPSAGRLRGTESIKKLRALPDPTRAEIDLVKGLYDEEVRYTDQGFGRLLAALDELGLKDETLIVFTADHGEEFYERGWLGHTRTLYDEIIRVPLLVRMPKGLRGGEVVRDRVSLVGLTPTVLDIMGINTKGSEFESPSFASLVLGRGGHAPSPIFAEVDFADRPREPGPGEPPSKKVRKRALIRGAFKLVQDLFTGNNELYDLEADPRERVDLAAERPDLVEAMAPELDAFSKRARADSLAHDERVISEEELETLKSLGYVGQ